MNKHELIKRLAAMKVCTRCQISGKPCDDNCEWQYIAGTMGETLQVLEQTIATLEQTNIFDKLRSDIEDWQTDIHDNEHDAKDHDFVFERIFEIIDEYRKAEE